MPEFYLKPWTNPADNKLLEYSRPHSEVISRRKFPSATGFKLDLYLIEGLPAGDRDWLEAKFFQLVDSEAALVRDKLLAFQRDLSVQERNAWARFLLSLLHRNPERIQWLRNEWDREKARIDLNLRTNYASIRRPGDPLTYDAMVAQSDPTSYDRSLANLLKNLMDSEFLGSHLLNMHWQLLKAKGSHDLLTSDRPLFTTNGLGHSESHLVLALDPGTLFLAANRPDVIRDLVRLGKAIVTRYNDQIVGGAYAYAYARDERSDLFVKRRFQRDAERWRTKLRLKAPPFWKENLLSG